MPGLTTIDTRTGFLSLQVEGMDAMSGIADAYRKGAAREYRKAVTDILKLARLAVIRELSAYEDTGGAIKSIVVRPPASNAAFTITGQVVSEGAADSYMDTIEFGRQAGSTPPPSSAMAGWISRHPGFDGTPFVLARAIGERGLPARHPWEKAFTWLETVGATDKIMSDAIDRVLGSM